MAANQRRKRLNGASIVGCSSREQHRTKRKNVGVTQTALNMKSHISVQWDDHQKKVIAKREQIGISWRNMSPFINSSHHNNNVLADIFTVPAEIFGLNNLTDLLSYKTWQNYLTENERKHLSQFLPRGLERDQAVQDLLDGENIHFGNPFLKWGTSLCSGDNHPDAIVLQEKHLKSNKKLHYSELHRYHNDMIKILMKLKERWESCEDPEMEIVQKTWRSGNGEEKRDFSHINKSKLYDPEENFLATSESGSWVADERACSSDNQFLLLLKGEKLQKRILEKDMRDGQNSLFSSDDTINIGSTPTKGDKLLKRNIHSSDGANYMSYVKITKRQLELVRSMKKANQSIQVKSLNDILGNLDGLHVQPYEVFVEEEQKNLRYSWLHLVNEDIPSAHASWRERQMLIERMKSLMEEEILEKLKPPAEDEKNGSFGSDDLQDQDDGGETNDECTEGEYEGSLPRSAEDQSPQEISSPSSADDLTPVGTNSEKNTVVSRVDDAQKFDIKYSSSLNTPYIPVSQEVYASSGGNVWQTVGIPNSYYDSTGSHDYSSVNGFSVASPRINKEKESRLFDPEISIHQEGADIALLHGYSDDGSFISYADQERNNILQAHLEQKHLLQSYKEKNNPNQSHGESINLLQAHQERNGLLECHQDHSNFLPSHQNQPDLLRPQQNRNDLHHSLFRDPGIFSLHEQNGTGLNFQTRSDVMMDNSQLSGHVKEPLQPSMLLEQGQKRPDDIYFGEHISDDVYPHGDRLLLPRQGHLSSVNMPGWAVTTAPMSASSQPHLNSAELLGQHWLPADQVGSGWTGLDGATLPIHSTGSRASSDQGIYSVLSQCSQLRSSIGYNSVRPCDPFITPRTDGVMDTSAPRINSFMLQTSRPLETGNSLVPDDMAWMNLPPQNSALHDQLGKPFLRSWNG